MQKHVADAISLFGDKEAGGIVLLRKFADYYNGYEAKDGKNVPRAWLRSSGGNRKQKKQTVIEKLKAFFEKFFGIGGGDLK